MLLQIVRIIWKDLKLEARNLPEIGGAAVFSVASSCLLGFAINMVPEEEVVPLISVGLLLLALFLAVFTALMTVVREHDLGTLDGIRVSPVKPVHLFLAKTIVNFILMEGLLSLSLVSTFLLSGGQLILFDLYALIMTAGIYLSAVSSFASSISVFIRARGVLLPTMILVLSLPILERVLSFMGSSDPLGIWMLALSGFMFALMGSWLIGYVLEV